MAQCDIIADVSRCLLELVRGAVCPALLPSPEQIALCAPDERESDAVLGLYLYGIRECGPYVPERQAGIHSGAASAPPLPLTLEYTVFFNRRPAAPIDAITQHRAFGRIFQLLYTNGSIDVKSIHTAADSSDGPAGVSLSKLDTHQKQEIWSGFSAALRPAAYFEVGPLLLRGAASSQERVREVEREVRQR